MTLYVPFIPVRTGVRRHVPETRSDQKMSIKEEEITIVVQSVVKTGGRHVDVRGTRKIENKKLRDFRIFVSNNPNAHFILIYLDQHFYGP